MPVEFAIDGHDGAAKTPIVAALKHELVALGLKVHTRAPFLEANQLLGEDIYPYWKADPQFANEQMLTVFSQPLPDVDIVIYDRHWLSVIVQLFGTPLESTWDTFIPAFYMQAPIEKTISCDRFSWNTPWTRSKEQLQHWIDTYNHAATKYAPHIHDRFTVSSRSQPLQPIVSSILGQLKCV